MAPAGAASELPLGPRSLDERRSAVTLAPGVSWTRIVREGGPWRVNVLSVAPGARVLAVPAGRRMGSRGLPSAVARRLGAVAAVNGGYFGAAGDPVGVLVSGGRVLSEPVGGRSALLLGSAPLVTGLRFAGTAVVGGEGRLLDGVNRVPGLVPACGGRGGDRPTQLPDAATTCTDRSELVAFTPEWGRRTPRSRGVSATVRGGVVESVRRGGTRVPPDGVALAGTGAAARLLADAVGEPVQLDFGLRASGTRGQPVRVGSGLRSSRAPISAPSVVGGGPRLLAGGRVRVLSAPEGFAPPSAPGFFGSFVASRHPRTLAGVRSDGGLLLVTVDGRAPGWSAGVTLHEAARVMRALGAREALNLDGGGSTTMAVRGKTVSRPSDRAGERAVSDALVVLP